MTTLPWQLVVGLVGFYAHERNFYVRPFMRTSCAFYELLRTAIKISTSSQAGSKLREISVSGSRMNRFGFARIKASRREADLLAFQNRIVERMQIIVSSRATKNNDVVLKNNILPV